MKVEYVLLQYCPDVLSESGRRIGMVYHCLGYNRLHVHSIVDWKRNLPEEDADFIQDVFNDLESLDDESALDAFERIGEMSCGPLRTESRGICEAQEKDASWLNLKLSEELD
jgi:hypothetical protein